MSDRACFPSVRLLSHMFTIDLGPGSNKYSHVGFVPLCRLSCDVINDNIKFFLYWGCSQHIIHGIQVYVWNCQVTPLLRFYRDFHALMR
jgi:hypothetical protein